MNTSPIPIGNSNRLVTLLNSSDNFSVFKNKTSRVIGVTDRGPIESYSISNDTVSSKFLKDEKKIYKSTPSRSNNQFGFLSFGPQQPYVEVTPASSNFVKHIKRFDTQSFPIGSVAQDVQRMSKFTVSTGGLLYNIKQIGLQNLNAFNETKIFNPLSTLQAVVQPASFGLIPRPKRHIDTSAGLLGGFLGSIGMGNTKTAPPPGTAADKSGVNTVLSRYTQDSAKGLIRAPTGKIARGNLLTRVGAVNSQTNSGGFMSNLGKKLVESLIPRFLNTRTPDQFTDVSGAIKYRADQDAYEIIKKNLDILGTGRGGLNNFNKNYSKDVHPTEKQQSTIIAGGVGDDRKSPLNSKYKFLATPVNTKLSQLVTSKEYTELMRTSFNGSGIKYTSQNTYITYSDISTSKKSNEDLKSNSNDINRTLATKGFANENLRNGDKINLTGILSETDSNFDAITKSDQIKFWFKDIINNKYIVFRSTISGINDSTNATWEALKYLGQPDSLYTYGGYERTISFGFKVYASSIRELHPMWQKINYLKSLCYPGKYQADAKRGGGGFMVAPLVKLTLGDMFINLPVAIQNVGVSIPDDVSWETLPATNGKYDYGLASQISVDSVRYGQYPTMVDIQISMNVFETNETPQAGSEVFGELAGPREFDYNGDEVDNSKFWVGHRNG